MDLKIILLLVAVIGGVFFITANPDFAGSVFDTDSCEAQKVNISNHVYSSKAELREDVLANGGETAWNDIQNNVANWETRNGALYFEPANCDKVMN
jgi:hypothetical protein